MAQHPQFDQISNYALELAHGGEDTIEDGVAGALLTLLARQTLPANLTLDQIREMTAEARSNVIGETLFDMDQPAESRSKGKSPEVITEALRARDEMYALIAAFREENPEPKAGVIRPTGPLPPHASGDANSTGMGRTLDEGE